MRLNRFFGDFDLAQKTLRISDGDFLHQVKNVLRLGAGEEIILVNGQGKEASAKIAQYGKDFVEVEILEVKENENEPERQVILYCAVLKRENFELVVQKAVEAGVSEIVPVISRCTVKTGLKYDRLKKIIKEAAEQSGRGIIPVLREAISFNDALAGAKENTANILFDASGTKLLMSDINNLVQQEKEQVGIFIGPEGGWSGEEIGAARGAGVKLISLGKLTLRAETAAMVASYLVCRG
ncbi:MAG: 16S rRNA (uracil(1498)-N(3))-methyltransferase [Candidatus Portnoybacteria bacterium]|nr:16S rRNA (uracil(1498)-N(3))-methyltransferase [Candidatus Portnoybacteria bacterium]MDD4982371.1 16S rRNA (uracil(1498)-N(3))-methyltransferase [Candidatus Portnoybacteria bacterium]